jgi:methionine-rich copper-binding protein CopC
MRKVITTLIVGCLAFLSIPTSSAHVEIVSSFPEQFANVNPIPTQVWIEFSGELQNLGGEIVNTIEVTDSTGLVVSYEDAVIEAGRITTKVSGQSAAGVFAVKYRVVGQDGHVIEGEYTFNASPEYAEAVPTTTSVLEENSSRPIGAAVFFLLVASLAVAFLKYRKSENK